MEKPFCYQSDGSDHTVRQRTIVQLAQLYDQDPVYASTINVMTTLVSIITMPLMVMLYLA